MMTVTLITLINYLLKPRIKTSLISICADTIYHYLFGRSQLNNPLDERTTNKQVTIPHFHCTSRNAIMFWRQFKFVVKKNLLVKSRHLTDLLLEILVPLIVVLGLWSIRLAINKAITKESIPSESLYVPSFDELFQYPDCQKETLIWNCATLDDTDCDVFDEEAQSWEGCLMKKIAVAPSSSSDAGQAKAARDFLTFTNNSQMSTRTPLNVSLFTYFESESAFIRHIRQKDYSSNTDIQVSVCVDWVF